MPVRRGVVIGASAGGLDALRTVINGFPTALNAPVFIVVHTAPEGPGLLSSILDRVGPLPARTARHLEVIENGHIYVAPPDRHLVIDDGRIRLTRGPREHRFRPAIDPLFRSAADTYGTGAIGIVLSGNMGDGTHGLLTIKRAGGVAIVQDPAQAQVPVMPLTAMQNVEVDYVVPDEEIGQLVTQIVMNSHHRDSPRNARPAMLPTPSPENPGPDALETGSLKGSPAPLTCPDCGGTLWEFKEGALVRYRCHVGHGFSEDSLANDQAERLEDILWSALRAIEESIELRKRMADRAEIRNLTAMLPELRRDIDDAERRADALRALLLEPQGSSSESAVAPAKTRRNDGKKKGR